MAERKQYLLRIPPEMWAALQRLADAELRSVNAQIELLLREGLHRRGGLPPPDPGSGQSDDSPGG